MPIPTEPIGSIPRPPALIDAVEDPSTPPERLAALIDEAVRDTIAQFEATGSPIITDGEQGKIMGFASYSVHGAPNISPHGYIALPFADGHNRPFPLLLAGPIRYRLYAADYVERARRYTNTPIKQAVIAASALGLIYPPDELPNYPRATFLADLVDEAERDIRGCLQAGAVNVQLDFTEGRLAIKFDPSKELLHSMIDLNNKVLERFSEAERRAIGVHTCPGSDQASTHSADIDYVDLIPDLLRINAGAFYFQLASEPDRARALRTIKEHLKPWQRIFVGVIDPINPQIETPGEVCSRVLEAADYIPIDQLGTTDDCGFSPFADDRTRARDVAFAKIRARVEGTALAAERLGVA
ncbi:MAG TPA: hypothetical protein VFX76_21775 [Roseiflexaceae bacterium]|nr:hypothetical protein [Roseiflexaceae bacterium]